MNANFRRALAHVLAFEGGYVDHPLDPGGATNLGITRRTLARFRGRPVTKAEVRALDKREAAEIYHRFYWETCRCPVLPVGLDLAMFDCGVNQGVGRAARILQRAVRVRADGKIGPRTLAAVRLRKPETLLQEFMARRMWRYGLLARLFPTFGLGWSRRLMATHTEALRLVR